MLGGAIRHVASSPLLSSRASPTGASHRCTVRACLRPAHRAAAPAPRQAPGRPRLQAARPSPPRSPSTVAMASVAAVDGGSGPAEAAYGAWSSPLTAELVTGSSKAIGGAWPAHDGGLLWLEGRPAEGGRNVLVWRPKGGEPVDITPADMNIRTRVHEYGGAAIAVDGATVYFSNFADQRLYKQAVGGGAPEPLTPDLEGSTLRYADASFAPEGGTIACVREDHRAGGEPRNEVVVLPSAGGEGAVVATGADFYAAPRISPDGSKIAWIQWQHPHMPWDATSLWVANVDGSGAECVIGADGASSTVQPRWSPEGELFFVSDFSNGWWNLCRSAGGQVEVVLPMEAEFGGPHWTFGQKWFDFTEEGAVLASYKKAGRCHVISIDPLTGAATDVDIPFSEVYGLSVHPGGKAMLSAASPTVAPCVVEMDIATGATEILLKSSTLDTDGALAPYLSQPRAVEFPTTGGATAHAIFYPPTNKDFKGTPGTRPPLLVKGHGGPTSATDSALKLGIQYWCSRGWAVADVNYRGSTGYGRPYRDALKANWGEVDVEDMCACAEYLAAAGEVDSARLAIDGGSAGGYTTLAALAFKSTFSAGASMYGISDLTALAGETHKFESRYLDQLVAPLEGNEELYRARSPINHLGSLSCPLILFQGLEDKVVPPNQARMMYEAVKEKGLPVALIEYEGEQHGFRKKENIIRTLEAEMLFFSRVFGGYEMADDVEPVHIDNID